MHNFTSRSKRYHSCSFICKTIKNDLKSARMGETVACLVEPADIVDLGRSFWKCMSSLPSAVYATEDRISSVLIAYA